METYPEQSLFFDLLKKSQVFGKTGAIMLSVAVKNATLPLPDYEYLLNVMKMEQNLYAVVDARVDEHLEAHKEKYQTKEDI